MSVIRYQRKPKPEPEGILHAARYDPGQPLSDLMKVARMADHYAGDAELAEVSLPSGPVLLVRYWRGRDDGPAKLEWEVVRPGEYLTWSESYDFLGTDTEDGLAQWYEEMKR